MDDTLKSTYASLKEQGVTDEVADEGSAERARDERGRFAAKAAQEAAQVEQQQLQQPAQQAEEKVPSSLSGAVKNQWGTLSAEVRQEFVKRENDFHKGITQYKQAAEFGSQMYKAVQPYLQTMQQLGVQPTQAIPALLQADHTLRNGSMQEKRELLGRIIQQYGITFTDEQQAQPQIDPNQIFQRIPQLVDQTISQRIEYMEVERAKQEVEAFAKGSDKYGLMTDPDGSPNAAFRQLMHSAIQSGFANDLPTAYEIAARAHPKSYEQMLAEQQAKKAEDQRKAQEEQLKAQAQKVAQARRSSSVNVKARGALAQVPATGSMEDTIRAKLKELRG